MFDFPYNSTVFTTTPIKRPVPLGPVQAPLDSSVSYDVVLLLQIKFLH